MIHCDLEGKKLYQNICLPIYCNYRNNCHCFFLMTFKEFIITWLCFRYFSKMNTTRTSHRNFGNWYLHMYAWGRRVHNCRRKPFKCLQIDPGNKQNKNNFLFIEENLSRSLINNLLYFFLHILLNGTRIFVLVSNRTRTKLKRCTLNKIVAKIEKLVWLFENTEIVLKMFIISFVPIPLFV